ncbi:hypothetical protein CPLU01_06737 [Colletotrichum plurivorum]|uniref:Uncharacterized protein n=1 Tax=Colletotrichum plurivorum TaxID=2175906 RepID=A0A8H6NFB1_9PEZI|nr:hypothetical protein CPLU01_06737 [Colletotrichum plurivorum]
MDRVGDFADFWYGGSEIIENVDDEKLWARGFWEEKFFLRSHAEIQRPMRDLSGGGGPLKPRGGHHRRRARGAFRVPFREPIRIGLLGPGGRGAMSRATPSCRSPSRAFVCQVQTRAF